MDSNYGTSVAGNDFGKVASHLGAPTIEGDADDDDEYGDDASSHDLRPHSKDAFNITAQSVKIQLDLLAQVSTALQSEQSRNPSLQISDPMMAQALNSYEAAVSNLKGLVGDLLRISRDRDAFWQYRLDREENVRRMWEESMTKVAKEQEELENRIGESEFKRRKTKRALREALEEFEMKGSDDEEDFADAEPSRPDLRQSTGISEQALRRKATIANIAADMSGSEEEDDEEFFDAVGAGEVEVIELPKESPVAELVAESPAQDAVFDQKHADISTGFRGYEDGPRKRLAMDEDNRPKISLWVSLIMSTSQWRC